MNRFARIALVLYCAVLFIIPLSYLHLEKLLPDNTILTNQEHQEIDLLVIIHEVLFAHLSNITDHLSRSTDRIFDQLIDQTSEMLFPDVAALKPCLLLPGLLACTFYVLRRYSSGKGAGPYPKRSSVTGCSSTLRRISLSASPGQGLFSMAIFSPFEQP